jgi:hypothetical protein
MAKTIPPIIRYFVVDVGVGFKMLAGRLRLRELTDHFPFVIGHFSFDH